MQIKGRTHIDILQKPLTKLHSHTLLIGINAIIVNYAYMEFDLWSIYQGYIPTSLTLTNPLNGDIIITHILANISYEDTLIASLNVTKEIFFPGNSTISTPFLLSKIQGLTLKELKALIGIIYCTISAFIRFKVNNFHASFEYKQENVSASFLPPTF